MPGKRQKGDCEKRSQNSFFLQSLFAGAADTVFSI